MDMQVNIKREHDLLKKWVGEGKEEEGALY